MEWMLMPLKRYAEFSGRSRRKEFWMFTLGLFLLGIVLGILLIVVGGASMMSASGDPAAGVAGMVAGVGIFGLVMAVFWLGLLIPSIAVGIRRLHDIDRTGWWLGGFYLLYAVSALSTFQVLPLPSAVSLILSLAVLALATTLIVFYCLEGTKGPNRFGDDPKGTGSAEVFA